MPASTSRINRRSQQPLTAEADEAMCEKAARRLDQGRAADGRRVVIHRPLPRAHPVALTQQSAMLNERPRNDRSPMNLRDVTAAAADRILDAASEFDPLPDALSDEPPTDLERQLLADAGCNLDPVHDLPPGRQGVTVRALRAGHEAGRMSVLHRPVPARTWRSSSRAAAWTLNVEQTDAGDSEVQLWIGDPYDGMSVLLDRAQTGQLVTDLLRRLALIGGRHAAVRAAADPSITHQCGPLTPTDPRSFGSVDGGGAR